MKSWLLSREGRTKGGSNRTARKNVRGHTRTREMYSNVTTPSTRWGCFPNECADIWATDNDIEQQSNNIICCCIMHRIYERTFDACMCVISKLCDNSTCPCPRYIYHYIFKITTRLACSFINSPNPQLWFFSFTLSCSFLLEFVFGFFFIGEI